MNRKSLPEQVSSALLKGIQEGRWPLRLPSYPILEKMMGVSRGTLRAALEILENRGEVFFSGGWRIRMPAALEGEPANREFLLLGEDSLEKLHPLSRAITERLFRLLRARKFQVTYVPCPVLVHRRPEQRLNRLLESHPHSRWILFKPLFPAIQWAASKRLNAFLVGGEVRGSGPFPSVGHVISKTLADLVRHMLRLGHRDVVVFRDYLGENGRTLALKELRQVFQDFRVPFDLERVLAPDGWSGPGEFMQVLESTFRKRIPTGIVLPAMGPATATLGLCRDLGLRVPEDISIAVTQLDSSASWHVPALCGCQLSDDPYVDAILKWVDDEAATPSGFKAILHRFVEGETLAVMRSFRKPA